MRAAFALLAVGLALPGCATTPINVTCDPFRARYTGPVPRSATMEEIQRGALPEELTSSRSREQLQVSLESTLGDAFAAESEKGPVLLALSGGGQWGAFGSAYLEELDGRSATRLPQFNTVTGVSTGALQALFVGAALAPGANRADILQELTKQYAPKSESEIVHRTSKYLAPIKGAVAKLGPLRRRIEAALCKGNALEPATPADCPLIRDLARDGAPTVLLGFVEVESGQMQYVNVTAIARDAARPEGDPARIPMKTAQQCITGGALASVAMPFFYQQVQVTSDPVDPEKPDRTVTYFDGGVRQSMFLFETTLALTELARQKRALLRPADAPDGEPAATDPAAEIYLVRNGPTIALPDRKANGKRDAISSAERGYSLIVNQSEVAAIETIRLRDKVAEVRLATADGYARNFPETGGKFCEKHDKEAMFEPQFMACLQEYGRYKAGKSGGGWTILSKPK